MSGTERHCEIVHTPAFVATAKGVLGAEQIRSLEVLVATNPEAGVVIPGTDGVRKLRIALSGRGKSGGARIIYYAHIPRERIYLFFVYAKNARENLTEDQKRVARRAVQAIQEGGY
jgi:hypothetical protein